MRVLLLVLCGTIACSGCASLTKDEAWKMPNLFSKKEKEPEPYPTPVKMATTWAPDTLSSPGKTTTRGFGGRIFFYNEKSQAVPVEGELLVVGYIDTGIAGEPPITRRYAFTSEQLTSHFAQSDLGASYSIWIPWDADGGMQHTISLVPTFTPKNGTAIQGAPTVVVLPGQTPLQAQYRQRARSQMEGQLPTGVRQVNYGQPPARIANGQSGLTTTTIPMNSDMTRRLR
ncbi:MAG: hypothetical protein KDJ29_21580 [Hyphomicrobiales bacterium]|nr:hypothetical protein [Hyphomicrobiales bacterium]